MNIIEKLKQLFKKDKTLALPEPDTTEKNIDNSWIIRNSNQNSQVNLSKLDIEITNFLNSYHQKISQISSYEPINNYKTAYSSLVQSTEQITEDAYYHNLNREGDFLTNLAFTNSYQVIEEGGFYHVRSQNYQMPNFADMARVYVSCKNENISELAQILCNTNINNNFYLKFVSNQSNAQLPRNEKIVIYCNKDEINYTINLLNACKNSRPDLFSESKALPFLKNIQNIASIAYQPITDQYRNLQGQTRQIPQSVNAFIVNILEEAYMESVREIARADNNLSFLFEQDNYYNETLYMQNYPYISYNYAEYLLNSMKAKMEILARNNGIEIDGLQQYSQYNKKGQREEQYTR